jgi:ribonuclease HI
MKYREQDTRSYRPLPANLAALEESKSEATFDTRPKSKSGAPAEGSPKPAKRPLAKDGGETIHVWTDGACSGNPGPMGIGVVVIAGDRRKEHGEYLGKGTNNVAELTAIQRGIEIANELAPGTHRAIRVYSDSSYAIGLLSQGWKAKANQELVAELRRLVQSHSNLRMVKVEGHAGVAENERCDVLARQAVAQNRFR